jgi:hypothetical protein
MTPLFSTTFEEEVGIMARTAPGRVGLLLSAGHDSPCIAIALHNNNIPFVAYTHSETIIKEDANTLQAVAGFVNEHQFIGFDTPGDLLTKVAKRDGIGSLFSGLGGDEMCHGNWQGIDEYIYLYRRACGWNNVLPCLPFCSPTINNAYEANGYGGRKPLQNYLARHGVPLPTKKVAFDEYLDPRGKNYGKEEIQSITNVTGPAAKREQLVEKSNEA